MARLLNACISSFSLRRMMVTTTINCNDGKWIIKTILKWFNDVNMYFSKFNKEDKRGQVNFLDGCVFWLHWHQLLINGNIYFHSWKSYFCSFSFNSVFFIPMFISLKRKTFLQLFYNCQIRLTQPTNNTGTVLSTPGAWKLRSRGTQDIGLFIVLMVGTPTCCYTSHFISPNHPRK